MTHAEPIKTVCTMCDVHCGIDAYVKDGRITKVNGMEEHPCHVLCPKGHAIPELSNSVLRLSSPLKKVEGEFKEISWDEALDFIAAKLTAIKEQHGAQAVNIHVGNAFIATQTEKIVRRFADLYGTPNYSTAGSFCFLARVIGHVLTCGDNLHAHITEETKCVLMWGHDPTETAPPEAVKINAVTKRGAKLIVVDPRATPLAKKADLHAQIRPGTDCALALGLLNVIIAENLYDRAFVDQWTVGFDELVDHVKQYSPERVEEITWIGAKTIRDMARIYAKSKPAAISLGVAMDHSTNGIQAIRAITILIAITGNLDSAGGNIFTPALRQTSVRVKDRAADVKGSISATYPLYSKLSLESTASLLPTAILTGKPYPIKALLVAGANPILTWPNTNRVKKAFARLEFVAVIDTFMTETAKLADIVLPAANFLERQDLRHYRPTGLALIVATHRVVEPFRNAKEDWKIWSELGRKMGYGEFFPWKTSDELFEYLLKPSGIKREDLLAKPGGIFYSPRAYRKWLPDGFSTQSRKVEIYSEVMQKHGYEPLPVFHEPAESPISRPDLAVNYPLILTTGARSVFYPNSQLHHVPSLHARLPEPLVEINSITAKERGIVNGELVRVESPRGCIELKARVTSDVHPRVVVVPHGWNEANANYLTDDENHDPVSAYPGFRSALCQVVKV